MEQRHVSLLVGRKSYNILTVLDEAALRDVYGLVHDIAAKTDTSMDQDERLFIVSMTLANELVSLAGRIGEMEKQLGEISGLPDVESTAGAEA